MRVIVNPVKKDSGRYLHSRLYKSLELKKVGINSVPPQCYTEASLSPIRDRPSIDAINYYIYYRSSKNRVRP